MGGLWINLTNHLCFSNRLTNHTWPNETIVIGCSRRIKNTVKYYYMAWLNSNVECGLLFLDNRPLLSAPLPWKTDTRLEAIQDKRLHAYNNNKKGVSWSLCLLPFVHNYSISSTFLSGFNFQNRRSLQNVSKFPRCSYMKGTHLRHHFNS